MVRLNHSSRFTRTSIKVKIRILSIHFNHFHPSGPKIKKNKKKKKKAIEGESQEAIEEAAADPKTAEEKKDD